MRSEAAGSGVAEEPPWRRPGYVFSRAGDGCWGCGWQRLGGFKTFLGVCGWFEAHGREAKEIPPTVVDEGCKLWEKKRG